jgi:hypothetical protein
LLAWVTVGDDVKRVPHQWRLWAALAAAAVIALVAWALWPSPQPAPRARPYLDYTACLLTDNDGITSPAARPVWAGMQDASLSTHARVQYLATNGEQTVGNALPYLASLLQRHCAVVVAVGPAPVSAVDAEAPKHPQTRFLVVNGTTPASNVTALDSLPDAELRDRVRTILTDAIHAATPQ